MIKVTRQFISWCIGLVIIFLMTNITYRDYHHVLLLFWLMLPVVSLMLLFWSIKSFDVNYEIVNSPIDRGQDALWQLVVNKNNPLLRLLIKIKVDKKEVFNIEDKIVKSTLHAGKVVPPLMEVEIISEFRLFSYTMKLDSNKNILALPLLEIPVLLEKHLSNLIERHSNNLAKISFMEDEFDHLDVLKPRESLKRVHWKLTSRHQRFIVARDKPPVVPTLKLVVLLLGDDMNQRDMVLDITSVIAFEYHQKGYHIEINNEKMTTILSVRTKLALMNNTTSSVNFDQLSLSNGLLIISDQVNDALINYLESLKNNKGYLSLIVMSDQKLQAIESLPNIQVLRVSDYV